MNRNKPIWNVTQHMATEAQMQDGVTNLPESYRERLKILMTFVVCPSKDDVRSRARNIANLVGEQAEQGDYVMIGGVPFLMPELRDQLLEDGYEVVYSFSLRDVVETQDIVTGEVTKRSVFKHAGFVVDPKPGWLYY